MKPTVAKRRKAILGLVLLALAPDALAALNCSVSYGSGLALGTYSPFAGTNTDVSQTLTWTCTRGALDIAAFNLCLSLTPVSDPRTLASGANSLNAQIYRDAARSQVWGSRTVSSPGAAININDSFPILTYSLNGSVTVYGRVPSGQTSAVPGSYSTAYTAETASRFLNFGDCSGSFSSTSTTTYTLSATVAAQCDPSFAVDTLDFGTQGLLTTDFDAIAIVRPRCTNTTPYQIGLDNGLYASGNTRRLRSGAGAYVTYELYRDSSRSLRWGNTLDVDTVSGTGSAAVQNVTIYGRVPSQVTPAAGIYTDTVTVTIHY